VALVVREERHAAFLQLLAHLERPGAVATGAGDLVAHCSNAGWSLFSSYDDGHQNAPKLYAPVCAPTAGPTR